MDGPDGIEAKYVPLVVCPWCGDMNPGDNTYCDGCDMGPMRADGRKIRTKRPRDVTFVHGDIDGADCLPLEADAAPANPDES